MLPSCAHLKPFGCLCYTTILKCNRDKLDPRAVPCVFIGYLFGMKGTNYTICPPKVSLSPEMW